MLAQQVFHEEIVEQLPPDGGLEGGDVDAAGKQVVGVGRDRVNRTDQLRDIAQDLSRVERVGILSDQIDETRACGGQRLQRRRNGGRGPTHVGQQEQQQVWILCGAYNRRQCVRHLGADVGQRVTHVFLPATKAPSTH